MNGMPDKERPAPEYDGFAGFYHRHWASSPYYREAEAVLDHLLFSHIPRGSAVLDLCCGSGLMTGAAVRRGFTVTGIDISGEMLRYARRELPKSVFLQCDARSFALPPLYRGAFSTFEGMNHILSGSCLEEVFRRTSDALAAGGVFVFDLLTGEAYENLWNGSYEMRERGKTCILRGSYDPLRGAAWTDVLIVGRGCGRTGFTIRISEKCHEPEEAARALAAAGLAGAELFSASSLGMTGKFSLGRVFLRAFKPGRLDYRRR